MPELCPFDYSVVRVVPRVERGEFVNAGVIVSCPGRNYLKARVELDAERLAALDPNFDRETVERHLNAIPLICEGGPQAGPIGLLPQRARFHWLVAPRSTIIQTSPVHTGFCEDGDAVLERLFDKMVRPPTAAS
ncbi:MAG TPA: DUF3037 domain-containing protein [Pyrinomonadaceae bacterium]|nr:DUF3037 domain-containing protein [Pyrinomonadaceae bacterium]